MSKQDWRSLAPPASSLTVKEPHTKYTQNRDYSAPRSSTQVWALCSDTRALREADISWFRHVASEKWACSLGMRCVTLAAPLYLSLSHDGPFHPAPRALVDKMRNNGFTKGTRRRVVLGYECADLCRRPCSARNLYFLGMVAAGILFPVFVSTVSLLKSETKEWLFLFQDYLFVRDFLFRHGSSKWSLAVFYKNG